MWYVKKWVVSGGPDASITTADKLLLIEAAISSDMLMYFCQNAQGYIPEEENLSA